MRTLLFWIKVTTIAVISVVTVAEILSSDRTYENKKIKEELNMTEEKMEAAMERMGDAIEKTVDGAANKAWSYRPVRIITKTLAFLTGIGLVVGAIPLAENGNHTASKICLISGCVVIVATIAELIFIRRK